MSKTATAQKPGPKPKVKPKGGNGNTIRRRVEVYRVFEKYIIDFEINHETDEAALDEAIRIIRSNTGEHNRELLRGGEDLVATVFKPGAPVFSKAPEVEGGTNSKEE